MARPTKSLENMTRNLTKEQRKQREIAENEVKALGKSNPEPVTAMNEVELQIFEKYANLNDSFNEFDSTSLSLLVNSLYQYNELNRAIKELDIFDDRRAGLVRQVATYDKAVQQHASALSLSLTQRLRMANDMAKIAIEEKKLANMEAPQVQEVNPLLAVLEATKNVK
ncbi:hypothetical protein ABEW33_23380 [Priestia megaterium]|uniref:hypothetical protein n=1 Tax=Priestia megaterium TaxID=1404 RepID=UPI0030C9AA76